MIISYIWGLTVSIVLFPKYVLLAIIATPRCGLSLYLGSYHVVDVRLVVLWFVWLVMVRSFVGFRFSACLI